MGTYLKDIFLNHLCGIALLVITLLAALLGTTKKTTGEWEIKHPLAPFFFLSSYFWVSFYFSFVAAVELRFLLGREKIEILYVIPLSWFIFGLSIFLVALLTRNWVDIFLYPASYFLSVSFSWKESINLLDSDIRIEEGKVIVNGAPWSEEYSPSLLFIELGKRIMVLAITQPMGILVARKLGVSLFCAWPSFFLFFLPVIRCFLYLIPVIVLSLYLFLEGPRLLFPRSKIDR